MGYGGRKGGLKSAQGPKKRTLLLLLLAGRATQVENCTMSSADGRCPQGTAPCESKVVGDAAIGGRSGVPSGGNTHSIFPAFPADGVGTNDSQWTLPMANTVWKASVRAAPTPFLSRAAISALAPPLLIDATGRTGPLCRCGRSDEEQPVRHGRRKGAVLAFVLNTAYSALAGHVLLAGQCLDEDLLRGSPPDGAWPAQG